VSSGKGDGGELRRSWRAMEEGVSIKRRMERRLVLRGRGKNDEGEHGSLVTSR
jgi:hypothetical protein